LKCFLTSSFGSERLLHTSVLAHATVYEVKIKHGQDHVQVEFSTLFLPKQSATRNKSHAHLFAHTHTHCHHIDCNHTMLCNNSSPVPFNSRHPRNCPFASSKTIQRNFSSVVAQQQCFSYSLQGCTALQISCTSCSAP